MKKFPSAALALFATTAMLVSAWAGCGSDRTDDQPTDGGNEAALDATNPLDDGAAPDDASADAIDESSFIDAIIDGSRADAGSCVANGTSCTNSTDCCSANCTAIGADAGKVCGNPINCKVAGTACTTGNECCLGSCVNKVCGAKACVADNGSCGVASDCCSGQCVPNGTGGGICAPLNCAPPPCTPACRTAGNPCAKDADCCGGFCNGGLCSSRGSFCTQTGDVCSTDFECCGGACTKAAGATLGICGLTSAPGVPGCSPSGALCGASAGGSDAGTLCDQNCCSRSCGPFGANGGLEVCEPPSGCKPTGEVCRTDSDCCGWSGAPPPVNGAVTCAKSSPSQELGRCDNGGACREPGSICKAGGFASCSAENNCCEPHFVDGGTVGSSYCNSDPANCCRQDALGIPRCLMVASNCATNPPPAGTTCATSADCCGKPCVNNKCDGACVQKGGACTTTADCCTGITCTLPPGGSLGICGGTVLSDGGVTDAGADTGTGGGTDGGNLPDGGTCALYGQVCSGSGSGNCCNAVPCISGTCHFP